MKVTAYSDNLYQLTYMGMMNCYLVREDDGFTLIDAIVGGQAQAIMQKARKLGLPIARIALTHAHADHIGSLDALHEALPDVPVAISERDTRFLSGDMSLDPLEPQTKLRGGYPGCQTKPTVLLREGDRFGSLEVIATPGHAAFFDTRDRAVIAGDAMQTLGGVAVSGTIRPLFPLPALSTWNKGLALESARKLLALQPSVLAIGHGRMLKQPQEAMERAIRVTERELAKEGGAQPHGA
ncbi:MBL fold metallo-hydrolase [Ktedonobacter robiniae]|uniref:MBL fold metallo-hydrolase n=1 Tax=Ktedonobacter robiniae TaxID=2778365 RepID=A0ABQ3V118_9CHLR|nr:MBL fold metallo-hydrolase [Ktedonobacter robiniae]GHO58487.1 MBL fold metallo-hydrolase [Ktedonobacter robiniae]